MAKQVAPPCRVSCPMVRVPHLTNQFSGRENPNKSTKGIPAFVLWLRREVQGWNHPPPLIKLLLIILLNLVKGFLLLQEISHTQKKKKIDEMKNGHYFQG